jgi:hypothetical protein
MDMGVIKPVKRLMQKYHIPVFYSGPIPFRSPWMQKFVTSDMPIFSLWDYPTKCLAMLTRYSECRQKQSNFKKMIKSEE